MPAKIPLPNTIRTSDPKALEILTEIARTSGEIRKDEVLQAARLTRRNELLAAARALGVSWADMGRAAEIAGETCLQIVQRLEAAEAS